MNGSTLMKLYEVTVRASDTLRRAAKIIRNRFSVF